METNSKDHKIIKELFQILTELDARECSANSVIPELASNSWCELCDKGITFFLKLKE